MLSTPSREKIVSTDWLVLKANSGLVEGDVVRLMHIYRGNKGKAKRKKSTTEEKWMTNDL